MRLDIGMRRAKKLFGTVACQVLYHVSKLADAVVTLDWVSFRIFIGEYRAGSLQYRQTDKILRSNELQTFMLPLDFLGNGAGNLRVSFGKWFRHGRICHIKNLTRTATTWLHQAPGFA